MTRTTMTRMTRTETPDCSDCCIKTVDSTTQRQVRLFLFFSCVLLPSLFGILLGNVHLNSKWKKGLADVLWVIKCSVDSFVGMWSGCKKSQDIKRDIVTSDCKIWGFYFVKVVKTQARNMQALYQNSDTHSYLSEL